MNFRTLNACAISLGAIAAIVGTLAGTPAKAATAGWTYDNGANITKPAEVARMRRAFFTCTNQALMSVAAADYPVSNGWYAIGRNMRLAQLRDTIRDNCMAAEGFVWADH